MTSVREMYLEPYVTITSNGQRRQYRSVISRFLPKLDRSGGPDACWEWQGYRNPFGYGEVGVRNRAVSFSHRVSYEIHTGAFIPPGLFVLHRCDNPPCCNPRHLFLGTQMDNARDMVAKGRSPRLRNELSGKAKLTDAQVAEIRSRRAAGEMCTTIAADFGVHPAHVSRVTRFLRRPPEAEAS